MIVAASSAGSSRDLERELATVGLAKAWESEAEKWVRWARAPAHDFYWNFGQPNLLDLLPPPGRGRSTWAAARGRVARDLTQHGHRVVGVDSSPTLISFARDANPDIEFVVADAAALPSPDDEFDLVVAYMSLMDIDDLSGAVRETARVLSPRGCFLLFDRPPDQLCRAFEGDTSASPFVIEASYLGERRYTDFLERDGLEMTFHSVHRPLETYARALEASGFALETIRKPPTTAHVEREERAARWRRIPCFLYGRARKT